MRLKLLSCSNEERIKENYSIITENIYILRHEYFSCLDCLPETEVAKVATR